MSNAIKLATALGFALTIAACSQPEPEVLMIEPAPIQPEPTFNKL